MKAMRTRSIRLTDEMVHSVEFVAANEQVEEAVAVRKLLRMGAEAYVSRLYEHGRITLREAAERLGTDLIGAVDLLAEHGIRGNLQAADVLASLEQFE